MPRDVQSLTESDTAGEAISRADGQATLSPPCIQMGAESPRKREDHTPGLGVGSCASGSGDGRDLERIKGLPREVGVMLVSVGVLGFLLPGVMGTPAIIAGGLALWPGTFSRAEDWLRRRNPSLYQQGMRQIGRFLDDLERRYPACCSGSSHQDSAQTACLSK
jgi:hypothetical protein